MIEDCSCPAIVDEVRSQIVTLRQKHDGEIMKARLERDPKLTLDILTLAMLISEKVSALEELTVKLAKRGQCSGEFKELQESMKILP